MQFLISTTFAVISLVCVASSCPSVCSCTETLQGVTVDCSNRKLDRIPTNLPMNTNEFDLSFNQITAIKSDTFKVLPKLNSLNMKNNNISFVNDTAFVNLPHLESLRFDMYCGCNSNVPFWKWLKVNEKFSSSIGCYDYKGYLENLQPNNFYKCHGTSSCSDIACLNGGTCYTHYYGYPTCSCRGDWTGTTCTVSPCSTVICNNGECYYNDSGIAKCRVISWRSVILLDATRVPGENHRTGTDCGAIFINA